MRILHVMLGKGRDDATLAVLKAQASGMSPIILGIEAAPAPEAAARFGIPTLWWRRDQSLSRLRDAVQLIQPDLVHIHGARSHDALLPPTLWAGIPGLLQFDADDFDATGRLHHAIRGMRFDRGIDRKLLALAPRHLAFAGPPTPQETPIGLGPLIWPQVENLSAEWFADLYSRAITRAAPQDNHLVLGRVA